MQKFCNSPFVVAIDFFLFDIKREVSWHSCCSRLTYWLIQIYDPSGKLNAASFTSSQYVSKALVGYKIMETLTAFRTFDIVPLDLLFLPHIVKPEGRVQFIRCHPKAALYRFAQKLNQDEKPNIHNYQAALLKTPAGHLHKSLPRWLCLPQQFNRKKDESTSFVAVRRWHFSILDKSETTTKNPTVRTTKQYSNINSCVDNCLIIRARHLRKSTEERICPGL